MSDPADTEPGWVATSRAVEALAAPEERAQFVLGAIESGFLGRLHEARSVRDLATASGLDEAVTEAICAVLRGLEVIHERPDGLLELSTTFAPIGDGGFDQRVIDRLRGAEARGRVLRDVFRRPATYGELDGADRLAVAAMATFDATTRFGRERILESVHTIPGYAEILEHGGRILELGSGVAGMICSVLAGYPSATAVGIEIQEDLVEEARRRARELGVDDRATFVAADAATWRDADGFDFVFWPQFFHAESTWDGALTSAFENLRPGGLLVVPEPVVADADLPPEQSVGAAVTALLRATWGVPTVAGADLRRALESAGFVDVSDALSHPPMALMVTARRP